MPVTPDSNDYNLSLRTPNHNKQVTFNETPPIKKKSEMIIKKYRQQVSQMSDQIRQSKLQMEDARNEMSKSKS